MIAGSVEGRWSSSRNPWEEQLNTPDKDPQVQEAESRKYDAPIVIPLRSGHFAVCFPDRQLLAIGDAAQLPLLVTNARDIWDASKEFRQAVARTKPPAPSRPDLDALVADIIL